MKRKDWKFRLAFGALLVGAVLKVTLVPNLQDTALYRPLKTGLSTLGWVLLIYLVYWYREQKRWEKATPEKSTVGNITRVREAARAAVSGSYPSANRVTRGSANKMPSPVSRAVSRVITDKKLPPKRKASFFPRWVRYSLNTGMKQAAMAEANTTSKKTRGMRLAM